MEIVPQEFAEPEITAAVEEKKLQPVEAYYRIPSICTVKLIDSGNVLMQTRMPIYQLGRESSLPVNVILK